MAWERVGKSIESLIIDLFSYLPFVVQPHLLSITEIKLNLSPNLFRLFLYLSDIILNSLNIPMTS